MEGLPGAEEDLLPTRVRFPLFFITVPLWTEISLETCSTTKTFSFEPDLNQRPKDVSTCTLYSPLQSSALPAELSKGDSNTLYLILLGIFISYVLWLVKHQISNSI